MSNELQIINEQEVLGKEFRVYGTVDEPLFLASDVADWIEHSRASEMLKTVDDGEKLLQTILASGQRREMWFLTEEGLYEVLMLSRKPIAKDFKKQVKEILKSIRKHGAYLTPKTTEELIANPDLIIELAMQLKNERLAKQQAELKLKEAKPKIDYYEKVLDSISEFTTTQVAKELCMTAKQLNKILANEGIQFKQNGQWLLYAEYNDKGYSKTRTSTYTDSKGNTQTKWLTVWTEAGREFLHELVESL